MAGDEVYGADPRLRAAIRGHGLGYVLAVGGQPARAHRMPARSASMRCPALMPHTGLAETLRRCGATAHALYSWAWFALLAEDDTDTGSTIC